MEYDCYALTNRVKMGTGNRLDSIRLNEWRCGTEKQTTYFAKVNSIKNCTEATTPTKPKTVMMLVVTLWLCLSHAMQCFILSIFVMDSRWCTNAWLVKICLMLLLYAGKLFVFQTIHFMCAHLLWNSSHEHLGHIRSSMISLWFQVDRGNLIVLLDQRPQTLILTLSRTASIRLCVCVCLHPTGEISYHIEQPASVMISFIGKISTGTNSFARKSHTFHQLDTIFELSTIPLIWKYCVLAGGYVSGILGLRKRPIIKSQISNCNVSSVSSSISQSNPTSFLGPILTNRTAFMAKWKDLFECHSHEVLIVKRKNVKRNLLRPRIDIPSPIAAEHKPLSVSNQVNLIFV